MPHLQMVYFLKVESFQATQKEVLEVVTWVDVVGE
jgi:hypothetical protein